MLWDKRTFLFYLPSVFSKTYTLADQISLEFEKLTQLRCYQHWAALVLSSTGAKGLLSPLCFCPPQSWMWLGAGLPSQCSSQSHHHQWGQLSLRSARLLSNDLKAITLCVCLSVFDKAPERYLSDEPSDWMIALLFQDIPTVHLYNHFCFILLLCINCTEKFLKATLCFFQVILPRKPWLTNAWWEQWWDEHCW